MLTLWAADGVGCGMWDVDIMACRCAPWDVGCKYTGDGLWEANILASIFFSSY